VLPLIAKWMRAVKWNRERKPPFPDLLTGEAIAMTVSTSWITKTPGVCGGEACIRDTRHTVSGLVQWKRLGLTNARILEHHPDLSLTDLEAAWDYFAQHPEEIEQSIREDEGA
jgi:uncharacterized protein (DUF433 family)